MISFCGFLESSLDFQYVCKSPSKSYVLHNACKNIHIYSLNVASNKSPIRHRPWEKEGGFFLHTEGRLLHLCEEPCLAGEDPRAEE